MEKLTKSLPLFKERNCSASIVLDSRTRRKNACEFPLSLRFTIDRKFFYYNMGIGKSRGASPINVNDMLEKVEINQQIETEKSEVDKLLVEIREAKETLIKFNADLEKAIAAECHIEGALKAAAGSCENIVNGIYNAIVKAERDTKFKTTITPNQLAKLRQLIDHSIENWISVLANHRAEQSRLITEHESYMRKILRRNEGVWYSDFWMKVLVIFLLVYTVGVGLIVYCAT